ncbi:MAG: OmpA family protein [Sphingobacteriales bacterium]|nr:MAG: OmpA family protein [Sphingobacteriales bacterium]
MKKVLLMMLMLCGLAHAQNANVYFDFDSHALSDKAKAKIDSTLTTFKYYSGVTATIQGFTDDAGTPGYNDTLALKRARAVEAYLKQVNPTLNATVNAQRLSTWPQGTTDAQKRRVVININNMAGCGYREEYEKRYPSGNGVIVIAANFKGRTDMPRPSVTTSFSAEEMIANNRFGVDTTGNILKSWGMIDIKGGQSDDGFYTLMVPITGTPDPDMSIWLPGDENADSVKWKDTDTQITIDPTGKYYVFRVPVSASGNTRVNLDKPCGNFAYSGNRFKVKNGKRVVYKTVYVATDKPYAFFKVNSGHKNYSMGFSAKINDTLYAFTLPKHLMSRGMSFSGWENGQEKPLTFRLSRCTYTKDANKNDYYAMNENTLKDKPKAQKTGFFAWIARQFS